MSLLDKQEVQYICGHTALRARKWIGYVNERQKIQHYRARSTEEIKKKKKECQMRFFTSRGAYVN